MYEFHQTTPMSRLLSSIMIVSLMCSVCLAENLLVNPKVYPSPGPWHTWARKGKPELAFDTTTGHGDSTSLRASAKEKGVDGSWLQALPCEGGAPYEYAFWFRTDPPGIAVSLLMEFGSAEGHYAGQHRREIKSDGAAWTCAEGTFVAPKQAVRMNFEVWSNLDNVGQGTAWFDDFFLAPSERPLINVTVESPLYRILRPDDAVRVKLTQSNPRSPTVKYELELRLRQTVIEKRADTLDGQVKLRLPKTSFSEDGSYTLSIAVRADGEIAYESQETIVRRAKPPLVYIGAKGQLLVDGKPFFPIGVYWARKEDLKRLPAAGFNCVHGWQYPGDKGRAFFDEAQRLGLRVILEMSDTLRGKTALNKIRERVEFFRNHPGLLCYYPVDEPHPPSTYSAGMRRAYNLVKALDPDHPIMYVQCNMALLGGFIGSTDIQAVDPYGSTAMVQRWMSQASEVSDHRKPVWSVLGAFPWGGKGGLPTPDYIRASVYVSLISGAKGILYFSYHFGEHNLKESPLWEPLTQVNAEIGKLAPWLLTAERIAPRISDKRIIAACFKNENGLILIAVNKSKSDTVDVELELPEVKAQARGVFDDAVLPCDGKLTLRLKPYGTAAFQFQPSAP